MARISQDKERFNMCLSGYLYQSTSRDVTIPAVISDLIFEHQRFKPSWDESISHQGLLIEDGVVRHVHQQRSSGYICSFGLKSPKSLKRCEWKIQIHKVAAYIKIGIIDEANATAQLCTFGDKPFGYGYNSSGQISNSQKWKDYGHAFQSNDVITVVLDMSQKEHTLSFQHNKKDYGVAYTVDSSKEYRFVVESYGEGDHYEMIE